MMVDPRFYGVVKRLGEVSKVYVILSSKGGVGKSVISALLAYYTSSKGVVTGLIDLDFTNPSTHIILGLDPEIIVYREDKGLEPFSLGNLRYFSIVSYTRDNPLTLKGDEARNIMREVLSIVNWRGVEKLFIDTPPGMSDEHLELIYNLKGLVRPVVISTPDQLSSKSVKRLLRVLKDAGLKNIYFIENMGTGVLKPYADEEGIKYLGSIPRINNFDECIGSLDKIESCSARSYYLDIAAKL